MKKICGIIFSILILLGFVGCSNNAGDSDDEVSLLGDVEITYTKPTLPELVGKDPFEGITFFTLEDDEDGWSYKINSQAKTIECYKDETIYAEMEYSYQNTDDGIILSVIKTKASINGVMKLYEDCLKTYEAGFKEWIKTFLQDDFDYYEENISSDTFDQEEWESYIKYTNEKFGTFFTKETYVRKNMDSLYEQIISTERTKEYFLYLLDMEKTLGEVVAQYLITIKDVEDSEAVVYMEGLYDESKQWYDQASVSFSNDDEEEGSDFEFTYINLGNKFFRGYTIVSIDDSSIKVRYYDDNNKEYYKTYPYTKTGSGVDTVISITDGDETIVLRANPRIF